MKKKQKLGLSILLIIFLTVSSSSHALSQSDVQSWIKRRLTKNAGYSVAPAIVVSGVNLHVVWHDNTPGNNEIYYRQSTDNGSTWGKTKRFTKNAGDSTATAIALSGSNIHVVWADETPGNYEIFYKRSVNNGVTWRKAKRLTRNTGWSSPPSIAAWGNKIHIAWTDTIPGKNEIYYRRSVDNGVTWGKTKRLTKTVLDSGDAVIAVSGRNVHVVWVKDTPVGSDIYYRRSTDNGVTWAKPKRLIQNAGSSDEPDIAVSGDDIHVVWKDSTPGNEEIFYKHSNNNGDTWGQTRRLTHTTGESGYPAVAVMSNNVYVVWHDNTPGNNEIYFIRSKNNGATWSKIKRLTQTAGTSERADASLSGSYIHVVWDDYLSGNTEVYYKRGP
jgi:hypothetical protein